MIKKDNLKTIKKGNVPLICMDINPNDSGLECVFRNKLGNGITFHQFFTAITPSGKPGGYFGCRGPQTKIIDRWKGLTVIPKEPLPKLKIP